MSKKALTKDELFLLKMHELALQTGDVFASLECHDIARAIGQNDKGASVIARNLAQANFVKKGEGETIYLTDNGLRLIECLQQ